MFQVTALTVLFAAAALAAPAVNQTSDDERILNGRAASPMAYPYQVSIQIVEQDLYTSRAAKFCGGVILDRNWILSAAHCFWDFNNINDLHILAGTTNGFGHHDYYAQLVPIKEVIMHHGYENVTFNDDIALVKLEIPLFFTSAVQSISLPPVGYEASGIGTIIGWGATDLNETVPSKDLLYAPIEVSTISDCEAHYPMVGKQICLGAHTKYNACAGDSGGPFIQHINHKPVVVGVTSFGAKGCDERLPIVYTKVSAYLSWIANIRATH